MPISGSRESPRSVIVPSDARRPPPGTTTHHGSSTSSRAAKRSSGTGSTTNARSSCPAEQLQERGVVRLLVEVDAQPRTTGAEEAHQTRQDRCARAREHTDADDGRAARERVELRDRRHQMAEHGGRVPGDDGAGGRQVGAARGAPVDQDRAEPLLELRDLVRDRRLGHVQRLRRAAEEPMLGDRLQRREVAQVDTVPAQCRLPRIGGSARHVGQGAKVAERRMPPDHHGMTVPSRDPPTACRSRTPRSFSGRGSRSSGDGEDRRGPRCDGGAGTRRRLARVRHEPLLPERLPGGRAHARAAVLPPAAAHRGAGADRPHGPGVRGPVAVVGPRRPHLHPPLGRTGGGAGRGRRPPASAPVASVRSSGSSSASGSPCSSSSASRRRWRRPRSSMPPRCSGTFACARRRGTSRRCAARAPARPRRTSGCSRSSGRDRPSARSPSRC